MRELLALLERGGEKEHWIRSQPGCSASSVRRQSGGRRLFSRCRERPGLWDVQAPPGSDHPPHVAQHLSLRLQTSWLLRRSPQGRAWGSNRPGFAFRHLITGCVTCGRVPGLWASGSPPVEGVVVIPPHRLAAGGLIELPMRERIAIRKVCKSQMFALDSTDWRGRVVRPNQGALGRST